MRIVLTGTPGTGKSSLAPALARLAGGPAVDLNAFASSRRLFKSEKGAFGEKIADLKRLKKALAGHLKNEENFVVEGHLACEFRIPADAVVVLRCDPRVLKKRLERRKYPAGKVRENVLAELLDYCLIRAEENRGKTAVIQADSTKRISSDALFKKIRSKKGDRVDWSKQLLDGKNAAFLLGT